MIQVKQILHCLEQAAPYELAEHWDNVGLLVGDPEARVEGVLCALDITETVVEEAAERGCNVIVAHHPVIFTSVSRVTADTVTGRIVISMIQKGISGICMHTNMDCADAGVNDLLAASLGLTDVVNMGAGEGGNLGRVGQSAAPDDAGAVCTARQAVFGCRRCSRGRRRKNGAACRCRRWCLR